MAGHAFVTFDPCLAPSRPQLHSAPSEHSARATGLVRGAVGLASSPGLLPGSARSPLRRTDAETPQHSAPSIRALWHVALGGPLTLGVDAARRQKRSLPPLLGNPQCTVAKYNPPRAGLKEALAPSPSKAPPKIHHQRTLEKQLERISSLMSALKSSRSQAESDAILSAHPHVSSIFPPQTPRGSPGIFVRSAVRLALQHLPPQDLRLLMLLVAAGQEHLLDTPPGWDDQHAMDQHQQGDQPLTSAGASPGPGGGLRGALSMLASMIEGWEQQGGEDKGTPRGSKDPLTELWEGFDNPGVFPAPVMQLLNWEGKFSSPHPSPSPPPPSSVSPSPSPSPPTPTASSPDSSFLPQQKPPLIFGQGDPQDFLSQFLEAFENPGVFPVPVLEMFDLEGRSEEGTDFLAQWLGFTSEEDEEEQAGAAQGPPETAAGVHREETPPGPVEELRRLVVMLRRMDKFYDSIGGILGYQALALHLILADERARASTPPANEGSCNGAASSAGTDAQASASGPASASASASSSRLQFSSPPGRDLAADPDFALEAALWGLEGLPFLAELYPLGGAGDRLGLVDSVTKEPLPVAMLQYCGRTLLEGLIRDLQAREYLHFRLFGRRHTTPVAIMTSAAKGNHSRVKSLLESHDWFGRGRENFFLFEQPLVPAVAALDGRWPSSGPLRPVLKPGGHGVVWKLAADEGVLDWLRHRHQRQAAIVRQISNPMAGTDVTLLALAGVGLRGKKKFGFASCKRNVGTAEGVNVLAHRQDQEGALVAGITCVEYTEFEKLGIVDVPVSSGSVQSQLPANTNVLYANLEAIQQALQGGSAAESSGQLCGSVAGDDVAEDSSQTGTLSQAQEKRPGGSGSLGLLGAGVPALPGMILNLKKNLSYYDTQGHMHSVRAGRIECTMQNIADFFTNTLPLRDDEETAEQPSSLYEEKISRSGLPSTAAVDAADLDTFLLYNGRRKVTSSAKRRRKPGEVSLHQTPEGSFLDLNRNSRDLFTSCGLDMPQMESNQCYVDTFPPFIFLFHPALGPLWHIIRHKVKGGSIALGSEVSLEIAELAWKNVQVEGSFLVEADSVMGRVESPSGPGSAVEPALQYGLGCGRCRLENVRVRNKGVFWDHPDNIFWQRKVVRHECLRVVIHGDGEFEARDVTVEGSLLLEVPAGHKMSLTAGRKGKLEVKLEKLKGGQASWTWHMVVRDLETKPSISVDLVEHSCA